MHIKNKKMEFTAKQNDYLKQLKNLDKLHKLQAKCEDFRKELENVITERSDGLAKRKILMERLTSVQEEFEYVRKEEYNWQRKLEAANQSLIDDKNDNLQSICLLLGYKIFKCQLLENNGLKVTLCYRDFCYVTYSETGLIFDLVEICPQHPNFSQIQQFLHNSQDLRGLLRCLRKFFDLTIEYNEKQEQK